MGQQDISIYELVAKLKRGDIQLPEMQRQYVWQKTRVRDLLDSLYRGYPSGTILTWETDEEKEIETRDFAVDVDKKNLGRRRFELLLDGQQRLTSLSAILNGELVHVRGRKRPIEILFNLRHPDNLEEITEVNEDEETEDDTDADPDESTTDANDDEILKRFDRMAFVVHTSKLASLPYWISVTDVFKESSDRLLLKKKGITTEDENYDMYSERLKKLRDIKNYTYRVHVLDRDKSYEEVTEIFVRVNSLGAKLRSSDLALAQITAKWKGSLQIFQEFEKECIKLHFDVGLAIHLKNLVVFATGQSRFKIVGNLSKYQLESAWEEAKEGMRFALNYLQSNAEINSHALLSSPFIIIALAAYGHSKGYELTQEENDSLRYWVLTASAKGRYSRGSTESFLDQDVAMLRRGKGIDALLQNLKTQVGRLEVLPSDLENRNRRSAYFKTMFMAFRKDEARDWLDKFVISHKHWGSRHALQGHHIFPRAVLKNLPGHKVNDICNLAFISARTNKWIGKRKPSDYLHEVIEKTNPGELSKQCIPNDKSLWKLEAYDDFLKERRKLVAERLNQFLGHQESKL